MPQVQLEKNSIAAGMKIFDKMYPNLQSIGGSINVEGTITTVSASISKIIIQYVPGERREECLREIDTLLQEVGNEPG